MSEDDDEQPDGDGAEPDDAQASELPPKDAIEELLRDRELRHFRPSRCRVLGVNLQPFTLWHWRELEAMNLPFTPRGSWKHSMPDLCAAVHILSLPANSKKSLTPGWLYRLRAQVFEASIDREIDTLFQWVMYHFAGPAKWLPKNARPVACPGWLYLTAQLIANRWSEDAAWAKTPGQARAYLAALQVANGEEDFLSAEDVLDALDAGYSLEAFGL